MTEDLGWVELGVRPDATNFGSSLSRSVDPAMDSVSRSAGSRFSSGFKKAVVAGAVGVAGAATLAVKFAGDAIDEAREAQKVGAQTVAVLKSTGGAARVTEKDVGKLATRLSNMAGIDDELIQSGENVILTFTNIRREAGKGNDIFKRATKVALDMSTALGTDLKGASIQVGKALNDPVKGITALQRVGVSFTNTQRAQIKALVEGGDANAAMALNLIQTSTEWSTLLKANGNDSQKTAAILTKDLTPAQKKLYDTYAEGGHTLEAQKRIVRELSKEFGGSAKAQANDSDKLKVAFGNLKEEIGTELLPYMDDLAKFIRKEGIPAARDFFHWFDDKGAPALKKVAHFAKTAAGAAKDLIGALDELPDPAKYAGLIALVGGAGLAKLRGGKGGALGTAGSVLGLAKPVNVFVTNPGFGSGTGVPGAGGKTPRLINTLPLVATLAFGGEALKNSGAPQSLSQKAFGTQEDTLGKALDGDAQALAQLKAQMKATADYWATFEFKADGAFNGVEKAIANSQNHVKQYQRILGLTPKQLTTVFKVNGIDRAVEQAKTLHSELQAAAEVTRGLDNGTTFQHGGQRGGASVYIGKAYLRDGRDLLQKGQQASLGGRRQ